MKNLLLIILLLTFSLNLAYADVEVTQGSGTVVDTDEVAGVHYPGQKISLGAAGTNEGYVGKTNRMPIGTNRTDGFAESSPSDITNTSASEVVPAGAAGVRHYAEVWIVSNSHATVGTVVQLLDGSTVKAQCPAAALFGGCVVPFPTPIRGSQATAWNCKNLTTGAAVRCTVTGFDLSE